jgi:hypothetical protein
MTTASDSCTYNVAALLIQVINNSLVVAAVEKLYCQQKSCDVIA